MRVSVALEQYLVLKLLKGNIHAVNSGQGLEQAPGGTDQPWPWRAQALCPEGV